MKIYFVKITDDFNDSFIETCASFFPLWRKEKMLAYKHFNGKIQNALGYLLLIKALKEEGVFNGLPDFYYNEHNKPFLKNYEGWYFNISHCKTAVCCVLSREEVGVDIEEIKEYKEQLAKYISNEEEFTSLQHSDNQADNFYKLWTQKEAIFKLTGTGITKEIKNIMSTENIRLISEKRDNFWISAATLESNEDNHSKMTL